MTNPLLDHPRLPPFSAIRAEHVEPAIDSLIEQGRARLQAVLEQAQAEGVRWDNLVAPLEEEDDRLNNAWSPVGHLNAVMNSEELRQAYTSSIAKLTAYGTEVGQNKALCDAWQALADSPDFAGLSQ